MVVCAHSLRIEAPMYARPFRNAAIVLVLLAVVTGSAAAGEVLDRVRDKGILVGATDPVWPPFSWRDPLGEYHGFDVEVTRAIADRLGARAEFVTPPWEEQVAGDWGDRWDIAVTNMTPTADRMARLEFPGVYLYGFAALAVRADDPSIVEVSDASRRRIAVVEDTIYDMYLRHEDMGIEGLPAVEHRIVDPVIEEYAVSGPHYLAVLEGRSDAVIDDLTAIDAQILQGRPLRVVGAPLFAAPAAVAVAQGDPEFAAEIARILAEMHADGTLSRLSETWFSQDRTTPRAGG